MPATRWSSPATAPFHRGSMSKKYPFRIELETFAGFAPVILIMKPHESTKLGKEIGMVFTQSSLL